VKQPKKLLPIDALIDALERERFTAPPPPRLNWLGQPITRRGRREAKRREVDLVEIEREVFGAAL
jgi:hypothetical protein